MNWVYVLESLAKGITYTGSTSLNVADRLKRHNQGDDPFTKKYRPWKIIYTERHESRSEAVKRERFLKTGKRSSGIKKVAAENSLGRPLPDGVRLSVARGGRIRPGTKSQAENGCEFLRLYTAKF